MKIFRSELIVGLKGKLFEISSVPMEQDSIRFAEELIRCTISSDKSPLGYYLRGMMSVSFFEQCDRCLTEFTDKHDIPFSILLTRKKELVSNNELAVMYFTDQDNSIDIEPILQEFLILETPLKKLCMENCKGLCPSCGCNLNENICVCKEKIIDSTWK